MKNKIMIRNNKIMNNLLLVNVADSLQLVGVAKVVGLSTLLDVTTKVDKRSFATEVEKTKSDLDKSQNNELKTKSVENSGNSREVDIKEITNEKIVEQFDKYHGKFSSKFMSVLMGSLYQDLENVNQPLHKVQERIENVVLDEYSMFFNEAKKNEKYKGFDYEALTPSLIKHLFNNESDILSSISKQRLYFNNLSKNTNKRNTESDLFINEIISKIDNEFLVNLC